MTSQSLDRLTTLTRRAREYRVIKRLLNYKSQNRKQALLFLHIHIAWNTPENLHHALKKLIMMRIISVALAASRSMDDVIVLVRRACHRVVQQLVQLEFQQVLPSPFLPISSRTVLQSL